MFRTVLAVLLIGTLPRVMLGEAHIGHAFGKQYAVVVTGEELKKAPVWDQSAENPPLSARKALNLVTDFIKTVKPGRANFEWRLEHIALRKTEGYWYWLAYFSALPNVSR